MWLILIIISYFGISSANQKCYALAFEGGGSHGAYEAGVLYEIVNTLPPEEVRYNIVSGISTGALNAAGVALYPMGKEKEMVDFVVDSWLNMNSTSVFEKWKGGIIDGFFFHSGWYNNAPLKKTISSLCTQGFHRNITVGSTNLDTGHFANLDESLGDENMVTAVICSASPPGYFPPTKFLGYNWADGGCVINLDLFAAVTRCLEVVDKESDIILDVLFDTYQPNLKDFERVKMNTWHVWKRVREIKKYDANIWFLYNAMIAYPDVNFRYSVFPSKPMPGGYVPLDFDIQDIEFEIELGKSDAKKMLNTLKSTREMIREKYHGKQTIIYP